jgi:hypothetical protein
MRLTLLNAGMFQSRDDRGTLTDDEIAFIARRGVFSYREHRVGTYIKGQGPKKPKNCSLLEPQTQELAFKK